MHAAATFLLLPGCAYSPPEVSTQSVSSVSGNPAVRYRSLVVFVENVDSGAQLGAEEAIAAALRKSGVQAKSSLEVFNYSRSVDDITKAKMIRSQGFDGVLFVTLVRAETATKPAPGIYQSTLNGAPVLCGSWSGGQWCKSPQLTEYSLDAQGQVVVATAIVVTQSTLEDVKTAQRVWASETTATANLKFGTASNLYELAAGNVVAKLRQDRVI
jgi:hypothetical protein